MIKYELKIYQFVSENWLCSLFVNNGEIFKIKDVSRQENYVIFNIIDQVSRVPVGIEHAPFSKMEGNFK